MLQCCELRCDTVAAFLPCRSAPSRRGLLLHASGSARTSAALLPYSRDRISEHPLDMECIITGIPRDIIEQIFLKLRVSSLLLCLGVCNTKSSEVFSLLQHTSNVHSAAPSYLPRQLDPGDNVLLGEAFSPSRCKSRPASR